MTLQVDLSGSFLASLAFKVAQDDHGSVLLPGSWLNTSSWCRSRDAARGLDHGSEEGVVWRHGGSDRRRPDSRSRERGSALLPSPGAGGTQAATIRASTGPSTASSKTYAADSGPSLALRPAPTPSPAITMENSPRATRAAPARQRPALLTPARRAAHHPVTIFVNTVAPASPAAGSTYVYGWVNLQPEEQEETRLCRRPRRPLR